MLAVIKQPSFSSFRRVSPDDVIVLKENSKFATWEELVKVPGSVIGTSSVRRTAQIKGHFPNLAFQDIRGNLNTRLKKLDNPEGPYDAIILAEAGILRLNWDHRIHRVRDFNVNFDNTPRLHVSLFDTAVEIIGTFYYFFHDEMFIL